MKRTLVLLVSIVLWNGCSPLREAKTGKPAKQPVLPSPLVYPNESLAKEAIKFNVSDPKGFTGRALVQLLKNERTLLLERLRFQGIEDNKLTTYLGVAIKGFSQVLGESAADDPIVGLTGYDRFIADRALVLLEKMDILVEVSGVCSGNDLQLLTMTFLLTMEGTFAEKNFWYGWRDFVYAGEVEDVDSLKMGMHANRLPAKYAFKGLFWGIDSEYDEVSVVLGDGKGNINLKVLSATPQKIVVNVPALGPALYPIMLSYAAKRGHDDYVHTTLRTYLPVTKDPSYVVSYVVKSTCKNASGDDARDKSGRFKEPVQEGSVGREVILPPLDANCESEVGVKLTGDNDRVVFFPVVKGSGLKTTYARTGFFMTWDPGDGSITVEVEPSSCEYIQ